MKGLMLYDDRLLAVINVFDLYFVAIAFQLPSVSIQIC